MVQVTIIMGSKSDMAVGEKCSGVLNALGIEHELRICSAHRTPDLLKEIVNSSDASVFIAIAGLSAALPGAVAALTTKPVIGVPVSGKVNLDSILSIVQMPPGIPVAAVGLDRGDNAALLAASILAASDLSLSEKLKLYREDMRKKVEADDISIRSD